MAELIERRDGATGWIVFSNPAKHNAVTYEMIRGLPELVAKLDRDAAVRVIGLAGEGESFMSGTDVTEFGRTRGSVGATATYNAALAEAYSAIVNCRKPTLAAIRGACFGIGVSLAVYCDLRVCAADAVFAHLASRLALGVSYESIKRVVDLIGPAHAAELLYTARRYRAEEAQAIGLVNQVVPTEEFARHVAVLCAAIAENAPLSITAAKHGRPDSTANTAHNTISRRMRSPPIDGLDWSSGTFAY